MLVMLPKLVILDATENCENAKEVLESVDDAEECAEDDRERAERTSPGFTLLCCLRSSPDVSTQVA
jgi:hypothetical protein